MPDSSWRDLEVWERVKWARARKYGSAAAAAAALDMLEGTYRCYERGPQSAKHINLDYSRARRFAREFRVRWEWLLDGVGQPWLTDEEPEARRRDDEEEHAKPPNTIRLWREYRGLTVAELAKKSGLGAQTIRDLESGAMDVSGKLLRALAPALDTSDGFLLNVDPKDNTSDLFDTFRSIPKERRKQALEILKTFRASPRER